MANQEFDVRRFSVGDWEIRLLTYSSPFDRDADIADIAKAAAEGLAIYIEGSFESGEYPTEGYAESCCRLASTILDGVRNIAKVEVTVDGDGVVMEVAEDAEW